MVAEEIKSGTVCNYIYIGKRGGCALNTIALCVFFCPNEKRHDVNLLFINLRSICHSLS